MLTTFNEFKKTLVETEMFSYNKYSSPLKLLIITLDGVEATDVIHYPTYKVLYAKIRGVNTCISVDHPHNWALTHL